MTVGYKETYVQETVRDGSPVELPLTKLVFDKFFALMLLILSIPFDLLIVIVGKADGLLHPENRGPIFYHEVRITEGRPFNLYKFRILKMTAIEEIRITTRTPKSVENTPGNLTNIGKVLKKLGIDEIPQFYSILRGDMSLIGPRPRPVPEYEQEIRDGHLQRRVIRAGLSGPAQLMKGTVRSFEDEVEANENYIVAVRRGPGWRVLLLDLKYVLGTMHLLCKLTGE